MDRQSFGLHPVSHFWSNTLIEILRYNVADLLGCDTNSYSFMLTWIAQPVLMATLQEFHAQKVKYREVASV